MSVPNQPVSDHQRLLANITALKANWTSLRTPSLEVSRNASIPIPDMDHRRRVQGIAAEKHPDHEAFLKKGVSDLRSVINIAEVYGVQLDENTSVLDWGVGCSRMARHMPRPLQKNFHGADVDPVNVEWSRQNVPFGTFSTLQPRGPAPFPDNSFDLIYSHSVLTHLAEADQDHWLAELNRISRGIMILSVHGLYSVSFSQWGPDENAFRNWLRRGISKGRTLPDIADVVEEGYYTEAAHTPAYIIGHWPKYLKVLDIINGGFGSQHDAVVCAPLSR